jgi:hypothetical protein
MTGVRLYLPQSRVKRLTSAALAAAVVMSPGLTLSSQTGKMYRARLSPVPIDGTMQSIIAGSGSVTAVLAGNKLTVNGRYDGLKSSATIVQIHRAQKGVRGPVLPGLDLKVSGGTTGTITGALDLNPTQVADLDKSWFYVQLHSEGAPDGNLWGWLLLQENQK